MSGVLYLYGFVPLDSPSPPDAVKGLEGRPVALVDLGPFRAAVSELPAGTYGEGRIESRLSDLGWVADRGARHETVVTWFADHGTILPARLFTIFTSEAALRSEARSREELVKAGIDRFRDLREWDLKVSYDPATLATRLSELSGEAADLDARLRTASAGRRYLLERKREEVTRREAASVARRLAVGLLETLEGRAVEVRELELPSSGEQVRVVLNAALLVPASEAEALAREASEAAAELEEKGVQASLTGPWAPYRFVTDGSSDA